MKQLTRTDYELIDKIVDRAESIGFYEGDRIDALIDITKACEHFNMTLEEWLNADDFNFAHDVAGIYSAINREVYPADFSNDPCFIPRFAGKEE